MPKRSPAFDAAAFHAVRGLLAVLGLLPWTARLRFAGMLGQLGVAASPKLRGRVHANLAHVMPTLTHAERAGIAREVGDCFGRTALELFSSADFEHARNWTSPRGPGLATVEAALSEGRGLIAVSGHYGAWEAVRHWFRLRGAPCATVYRRLDNPRIEALYRAQIERTGAPLFAKNRPAARGLLRHLSQGGVVALLVDQYQGRGRQLDFLGRPAPTTTIPAEIALRAGVPLVPAFATRTDDGRSIELSFARPVSHSTPEEMMQAVNDAIAEAVRAHPGQYYWFHRRWSKHLTDPADPAPDPSGPRASEPDGASRREPDGRADRET